jgi:uncharacterized Zn-finger protein
MNFYLQLTERKSMVEILCPHCEEEIQLDDDAAGEFGCPYCESEFEWGMHDEDEKVMIADVLNDRNQNQVVYIHHQSHAKNPTPALILSVIVLFGAVASLLLPYCGLCYILFVIPAYIYVSSVKNASKHSVGVPDADAKKRKSTARISWIVANAALILTIIALVFSVIQIVFLAGEAADEVGSTCITFGGSC